MADLAQRMDEYRKYKDQKHQEKEEARNNQLELAKFIGFLETGEAVLYQGDQNRNLVIVKDCENCLVDNIGIISNFIPGLLSDLAKRSTPNMSNFSSDEIDELLKFLASDKTKILKVLDLGRIGKDLRWRYEQIYKQHFER